VVPVLVERYGKMYPKLEAWVHYLEAANGWYDRSILQSLGADIRRNIPTLEEFGLTDFRVYVLFSRWEFGAEPFAVKTLTFHVSPFASLPMRN
jgi:hypothetical protein